jgi:hypothetical protein
MRAISIRSGFARALLVALPAVFGTVGMHAYGQDGSTTPGVADRAPPLSTTQRSAIYSAVSQEKAKVKLSLAFNPVVGAKVPPSIALYTLPVSTLVDIPSIRSYQYTVVHDQVVLVDPTTLQVVDIIRQ